MTSEAHKEFWKALSPEDRESLAAQAETSAGYLRQVLIYGRKPSAAMAKRLEVASAGRLTRKALRPDLFAGMTTAN